MRATAQPSHTAAQPTLATAQPTTAAAQPARPVVQTAPRPQTPTLRSFSLRRSAQQTQQQQVEEQQEAAVVVTEERPFDNVELTIAWREFAAALPHEEIAMSHRMDNMEPALQEDGTTFLVIADNPSILNELEHMTPRIENFLRQRLRNGKVHMTLRLREITDKRKVYSRKEIYQMLLEQSQALRKLREAFQLELA